MDYANWETHRAGGLVEHFTDIGPSAVIESPAQIYQGVEVWGGRISGKSSLRGDTRVTGQSVIHNSHLVNGPSVSDRAVIVDSALAGDVMAIDDCFIDRCGLEGQVRIGGNAVLENVGAKGRIVILGGHVSDCVLSPGTRITGGRWTRAPRVVDLGFMTVCEAHENSVWLDCKLWGVQKVLKAGPRLGRILGFSDEDVDRIRVAILAVTA